MDYTIYSHTFTRSFETHNSTTKNADKHINFDEIPFKLQVEDVMSNFVQMYIFFNTEQLTSKQKELLPVLLDVWMTSPLLINGTFVDIETVIKRQTKTLLHSDYFLGFSGKMDIPKIL